MGIDPKAAGPFGGLGETFEADATFVGKETNKHAGKRTKGKVRGGIRKHVVHTLFERGGKARSHHVPTVTAKTLRPVMFKNIDRKSSLMTDEGISYRGIGRHFASHSKVDHSAGEYVRGDAYSNTAEAFFAILKRGIYGTFHSVSEAHLSRYLNEFDSGGRTVLSLALTILSARPSPSRAPKASGSCTPNLTKPRTKKQRIALIKRVAKRLKQKPPQD